MKELKRKLWRKAIAGRGGVGIILMVIGVICLAVFDRNQIRFYTTDTDVFSLCAEELETEGYYSCDNNLLLDYYAMDEEGNYCITPIDRTDGTTSYMGFYVYYKDSSSSDLDRIMDETWEFLNGGEVPSEYLSGKGYVYKMPYDERRYFKSWFEEAGAGQEVMDNLCFMTFVLVPESEIWTTWAILGLILFLVFFLWGLYMILSLPAGIYLKKIKKTMQKFGISEEALVYDLQMGRELKRAIIGRRCIVLYGGTPRLILCDQLIWCYLYIQKTRHRLYGVIPVGTTTFYWIKLITRENKEELIEVKNEEEGHEILQAIFEAAPFVLMGYNDRLAQTRSSNFVQMIQMVEQKKNGI